ncbi:MAG: single-stranded DNA-binding protein [Aphanocapsa sp. GSE-SYN-MK-11-07L]|jgi:single-strand DNA-binding protein|nr:single-stranded DNA-binding protein [Aphanocapsa sp. GSE-SYN-MK-11-07L]
MNTVALIGRLTADPEVRYLDSGKAIAKFSLAISRTKEETDYFEVEAWEKTAEIIADYCKKGSQIGVTGSLLQQRWKDTTTGANRSKVVIRAARVELLSVKQEEQALDGQKVA